MAELVFENAETGRQYKVVKFDQEAGTVTLLGPHNMPFVEPADKERFARMGYTLKQVDEAPAAPTPPAPPPPASVVVG